MKLHVFHFVVLLLILGIGIGMFFQAQGNRSFQLTIGVATSIAYILWGMIHHAIQRDLHRKVVIEYVLLGVIAVLLLVTVLGS